MTDLLTTSVDDLEARWDALYLNLMLLDSDSPEKRELLKDFQAELIQFHLKITELFRELKGQAEA